MLEVHTAISSDGEQIVYEADGLGDTTLLFIHGWSCNRSHWQFQIPEFSADYRVISVDLAGHGESGKERKDWSLSRFADDVLAVLDQEQGASVVLVGDSMGGGVMLHAGEKLGDRLLGFVGADTLRGNVALSADVSLTERLAGLKKEYERTAVEWFTGMFTQQTPDSLKQIVMDALLATPAHVGIGALEGSLQTRPMLGLVSSLQVPATTILAAGSAADD